MTPNNIRNEQWNTIWLKMLYVKFLTEQQSEFIKSRSFKTDSKQIEQIYYLTAW